MKRQNELLLHAGPESSLPCFRTVDRGKNSPLAHRILATYEEYAWQKWGADEGIVVLERYVLGCVRAQVMDM